MLFLALAAGGAAVLEVHRAIAGKAGSDPEVVAMRQREQELKEALAAAQRALEQEKQQREREHMAAEVLSASVKDLETKTSNLEAKAADLQAAKDALEDHSKLLLRRFEELEREAATLQDGNDTLSQQVEALKLESDAEVARTLEQVEQLKQEVAAAVQAWGDGAMTAEAFLGEMRQLGVEVRCAPAALPPLPAAQLLQREDLQLAYDSSWTSKMQLVTDSRERMSRLLCSAAARQSGTLPPRHAGALTFPTAKTPPRDAGMSRRLDMTGFSASALTPRSARAAGQALMDATAPAPAQKQAAKQLAAPQRPALQSLDNVSPPAAPAQPKADKKMAARKKPMMQMPRLQFVDSDDDFSSSRALARV